jgi:hypothetical protein
MTSSSPIDRRRFLAWAAAGTGALASAACAGCDSVDSAALPAVKKERPVPFAEKPIPYPANRPNVILVRFGGGVRRRETVQFPERTWCPFILKELAQKRGVLFSNVEIASNPGVVTSHSQGTLYLLTGEYGRYKDVTGKPLAYRFIAAAPTLPEYLRRRYSDVSAHQALIVNAEDRLYEEFCTFSNHDHFGINYRSTVLSLYGYRTFLLRRQLRGNLSTKEKAEKEKQLREMLALDYRVSKDDPDRSNPRIDEFWAGWRRHYGESGLAQPRGDRLLTALALRALKELRPRFLMINYQDTDYVHWGPAHFYTRAISIIDEGVRELYHAVESDEYYRDNTVFVIVPDCGRDNNRAMAIPYQHHFGSRTAHDIFAILAGPRKFIPRSVTPIGRLQQQISVAATVGELMGFTATHADAESLFKVV